MNETQGEVSTEIWEYRPEYNEAGNKNVKVIMRGENWSLSHVWNVTVENVNREPVIKNIAPDTLTLKIKEGDTIQFSIDASDPDGDKLSFRRTINGREEESTEEFLTYIPTESGVKKVVVTINDTEKEVSHKWIVFVDGVNHPPTIASLETNTGTWAVKEAESITFKVKAYDTEGDNLSYFWNVTGEEPVQSNESWNYSPKYSEAGNKTVYVTVSDGNLKDSSNRPIRVIDVNAPPVISYLYPDGERRLFSWNDDLGNDSIGLKNYLRDEHNINWVKKPIKSDRNGNIHFFADEKSVNITIDNSCTNLSFYFG